VKTATISWKREETEMKIRSLLTILALLGIIYATQAQTTGKISAKVTEASTGLGINLVTVALIQDNVTRFSTRTNIAGNFSFVNVGAGSYVIQVKKDGYRDFKKTIVLNAGVTLKLKIDLPSLKEEKQISGAVYASGTTMQSQPVRDTARKAEKINPVTQIAQTEPTEPVFVGAVSDTMEFYADMSGEGTTESEVIPDYMEFPDQPAEPEGGLSGITRNVVYPQSAMQLKIEGKVVLSVIVDQDGNPTQINILSPAHEVLNEAAIETVYKTKFKPANHNGKLVTSRVSVPVQFRLKAR